MVLKTPPQSQVAMARTGASTLLLSTRVTMSPGLTPLDRSALASLLAVGSSSLIRILFLLRPSTIQVRSFPRI